MDVTRTRSGVFGEFVDDMRPARRLTEEPVGKQFFFLYFWVLSAAVYICWMNGSLIGVRNICLRKTNIGVDSFIKSMRI